MEKERNLSIDILRICSMMAIVALHFLNLGGMLDAKSSSVVNTCIVREMYILCFISVNVFGILTGYLNVYKNDYKWNRIIDLLVSVIFWCIVITVIMGFFSDKMNGVKDYISSLCPPLFDRYWYIVSYIFVYFMMPYLNKFVNSISKDTLKKFLIVILILLSVIPTLGYTDFFRTNTGSSAIWLTTCYLFGAYIRKYGNDYKIKSKKIILFFISISLGILLWWIMIEKITRKIFGRPLLEKIWVQSYCSLPIVIMSLLFFIWIINKKTNDNTKFKEKVIKTIAGGMFDVYIIHSNPAIWDKILSPIINKSAEYIVNQFPLICLMYVIIGILIIVIVTLSLGLLRQFLFRTLKIFVIENKIADFANRKLNLNSSN